MLKLDRIQVSFPQLEFIRMLANRSEMSTEEKIQLNMSVNTIKQIIADYEHDVITQRRTIESLNAIIKMNSKDER